MFCAHQARERCGALVYELQDGQDQLSAALQEREALRADLAASMDLVQASVAACDGLRCRVDDVNRQQRRDRNQAEAWHADAMELQHKLESRYKIQKLRKLLKDLKDNYERIYIDTAPAFNFYTMSALIAADRVLIPFDCDSFSRQALYGLLTELEDVREEHNEDLAVEGIVVNQFQPRAALPQKMLDELIAEGLPVLPVHLNSSVRMRESHEAARPLIFLDGRHKLTQQFMALHDHIEAQ